ncbi:AEC family transporter [Pseudomonas syringae]|uniref:AEC family transporter n=1 Tax=Pseudomonas syringae TaxID=317 RepID=UPI0018E609B9|nr:AEC family transporter [Pseudomonas syringae]MBI6750939.1 AEC family transporter [Pseudomonas syringae]MBI6769244.1 AEC family transporter [Pseudomonas syringae]MBI6778563.1 AEC family transporter [Pseudomonas syringae]MBI6793736.1 AEC family transporter [Pseudomonas syringae]MBI6804467.1 AEC family transporter [Pseudomonas syringae]
MTSVLGVILPIFALILAGYLCRRFQLLGPQAASELNRMVIWLCLPALLFEAMATVVWEDIWQPGFIFSYGLATLGLFVLVLLWSMRRSGSLADASVKGLSASYANTGYMGIPLCLLVFGDAGMEPALIASLIIICVLFSLAVVCIEVGLQSEPNIGRAAAKVCMALLKNPVVIAPILGGLWATTAQPLPAPIHQFLKLLSAATGPCALVSLGLFLAHKHQGASDRGTGLVLVKLFAHPALTWFLAAYVFHLPVMWTKAAVLLSALPTGTGPFMLAEFYRRDGAQVSSTILLSTLGSLITLSACLYFIGH